MLIENYQLEGGLSEQQIEVMKEKALDLVEKVGIYVPHEGILKLLSDYDGVTIDKEDVKFKSDPVLKALKVGAAGIFASMVPVIVIYLIGRRSFIKGLTAGALKG